MTGTLAVGLQRRWEGDGTVVVSRSGGLVCKGPPPDDGTVDCCVLERGGVADRAREDEGATDEEVVEERVYGGGCGSTGWSVDPRGMAITEDVEVDAALDR